MRFKILLFCFLGQSLFSLLIAQSNIQFENITTDNGLASAQVSQVIQDKKDFLWIATTNGLNRFDGHDFKVFRHHKNIPNSISDNNIRCLFEDSRGFIWVGTLHSGLNRYDYKTGKFVHFFYKNNKQSISSNEILSIFEDSQGRLWIGTEKGLNLFDYETETFTSFLPDDEDEKSLQSPAVLTIAEDNRGWLWVGTWGGGLNLMIPTKNPKQFEFRHFLSGEGDNDLKSNHVWKIFLDDENRLWLGMFDGGLSVILPNKETNPRKFTPVFQTFFQEENNQIASNVVFDIKQDKQGQFWLATVDGLSMFKTKTQNYNKTATYKITESRTYKSEFSNNHSLVNNEMRNILIDKSGIVWCSTTGGISKFDKHSTHFSHFLPNIHSEINNLITAITEYNKDIVYIAGHPEFGLIEYNQKTGATQSLYIDGEKNGFFKTGFTTFHNVSLDTIWIGTRTGIVYFNPITKSFKDYELKRPNGELCQVKKIVQDKQGQLWLGTNHGLVIFDTKNGIANYPEKDSKNQSINTLDISDILFDNQNRLWLATYGGLGRLDFKNNGQFVFKNYMNQIHDSTSICSNRIINLTLLKDEIWAGTENGLARYNAKTDDFRNFKSADGLEISAISSMVTDNKNRLWLGTRQGLIVFNPKTFGFIHYNKKDGIKSNIFMLNSVDKNKEGTLYFGSTNGYIRFKNEDIKSNKFIPPIRITDITIFNKPHAWQKDVSILKEITLQPDENYFTVEFAALNFTQSSDNQYAYMLEGFNKDWIDCGHKKSVSFSNLDGGTYTLRIKASNNDGVWNEEGIHLKIIVIPSIWKRLWFQLLLAFIVIGLGVLFYFRRINRIEKQKTILENQVQTRTEEIRTQKVQIEALVEELKTQNNQLEKIVQERTKTLERSNLELMRSNQDLEQFAFVASHDLQEPLRTIGSFTQLLNRKYQNEEDKQSKLYRQHIIDGVKRMSGLIKSLLNYSRLGRNDIQFSLVNTQEIIDNKIADLLVKIQEKNATVSIGTLPEKILCEPNQIGVVFYNLINNGLKFNTNPNPKITVQLENEDENYWTFSITDNGIGIDKIYKEKVFEIFKRLHTASKFEGTGIGLAFCKRIILRHEGDIWFKSTLGEGTTFYFTIHKHIKIIDNT